MVFPRTALNLVHRELDLFVRFSKRDWSASFGPSLIFSVAAMRTPRASPTSTSIFSRYLFLILWTALYIYFFDLLNQIIGLAEDRINKPDRPLPQGKVTIAGAKLRCAAVLTAFLSMSLYYPSVLPETLCWALTTAFLCLTPAGQHWFGKNCIGMTAGSWALLSTSWKAIAPATTQSRHMVCAIALWVGLVMHIQDLRDAKGDAVIGRKTLPLVFGERTGRAIITFCLLPLGFGVLWLGGVTQSGSHVLAAIHLYLAWRVMQTTAGPRYDHRTYMIYIYTLCLILAFTAARSLEQKTSYPLASDLVHATLTIGNSNMTQVLY